MAAALIGEPGTADESGSTAAERPVATASEPAAGPVADTPDAHDARVEAGTREQNPRIDEAYLRLLSAEIRRCTPTSVNFETDSAEVVFTVGASGRIVDYKFKTTPNQKEVEPFIGRIMTSVQMPPPPAGAFTATQKFNFAGTADENGSTAAERSMATASEPAADTPDDARVEGKAETGATERKAYLRLLSAEIRRRTPSSADIEADSAEVVFTVGASGRIVDYKFKTTPNQKEVEPFIRRIMTSVQMPPPPAGPLTVTQKFHFSHSEQESSSFSSSAPAGLWRDYLRRAWNVLEKRKAMDRVPHGVIALFHVDATGRIDDVKIANANSPEQEGIVRDIFLGLETAPPPSAGYLKGYF
jgi:hypothetical protein